MALHNCYVSVCDHCGQQHQPMRTSHTPHQAQEAAKRDGWYVEPLGVTLCEDCRDDPALTGINEKEVK